MEESIGRYAIVASVSANQAGLGIDAIVVHHLKRAFRRFVAQKMSRPKASAPTEELVNVSDMLLNRVQNP